MWSRDFLDKIGPGSLVKNTLAAGNNPNLKFLVRVRRSNESSILNEYSIASCSTLSANVIVDLFYSRFNSRLLSVADEFTIYKTDTSRGSYESRICDYLKCHPIIVSRIRHFSALTLIFCRVTLIGTENNAKIQHTFAGSIDIKRRGLI